MLLNQPAEHQELISLTGICREVHTEELSSSPDLFALARARSHEPGCVFLASGGDVDSARHHILALRPWFVLESKDSTWTCRQGGRMISGSDSPLSVLRSVLEANALPAQPDQGPARAGLFGYFSYELSRHIESLPCTSLDDTGLPDMYLTAPSILVTQEIQSGRTWLHLPMWDHTKAPGLHERLSLCYGWIHDSQLPMPDNRTCQAGMPRSSLTQSQYLRAVDAILEYIRAGHVYQVNLSQRLVHTFQGSAFDLFFDLFIRNPAPFYAYVQAGGHQVVSTSPERFLKVHNSRVETRPIKGTRPRGTTPDQDQALARELQESPKDGAELAMIVDLMRNDLGRVCSPGSVQVAEHKRLEAYDNVLHLVSIVHGCLEPEHDLVDVIQATFPGGSITGCPKIRAMEIIDQLEPFQRHAYTGSIGYLGFEGHMDLSIAIRTAVITAGRLVYSVGGGVVIDSDPQEEYQETWHKGRTFAQVLNAADHPHESQARIWHNGHLVPEGEALCALRSPAVEYGFGVFETLRADHGHTWFVPEHIARMNQAWLQLTGHSLPRVDWERIISQVLEANGLKTAAAVKVYAGRDQDADTLCVSARAYTHRLAGEDRNHLLLVTSPEPRQSPLAGMKTANHLVYILAGEWARQQNQDEALILNPEGTVSETSSANLILICSSQAVIPQSPHVLPGIMQHQARIALGTLGFACVQRQVHPHDLYFADAVLLTNSLLGVIGAGSLDGKPLTVRDDVVKRLNELIFGFQP
ncbi:MAG: aminodeoxychorismate synthase component I [Thermodesulfobacteriota bacterium]